MEILFRESLFPLNTSSDPRRHTAYNRPTFSATLLEPPASERCRNIKIKIHRLTGKLVRGGNHIIPLALFAPHQDAVHNKVLTGMMILDPADLRFLPMPQIQPFRDHDRRLDRTSIRPGSVHLQIIQTVRADMIRIAGIELPSLHLARTRANSPDMIFVGSS